MESSRGKRWAEGLCALQLPDYNASGDWDASGLLLGRKEGEDDSMDVHSDHQTFVFNVDSLLIGIRAVRPSLMAAA